MYPLESESIELNYQSCVEHEDPRLPNGTWATFEVQSIMPNPALWTPLLAVSGVRVYE